MAADRTLLRLIAIFTGVVFASVLGGIVALIGFGEWNVLYFSLAGLIGGYVLVEALNFILRNKRLR